MSNTSVALLGYASWTLLLILWIEVYRVYLVAGKGYLSTSFKPDGSDVSPFMGRLCRAHANCVENFPIIGGLLVVALATENRAVTEPTALLMLLARVAQSLVHVASGSPLAVNIRFLFFAIQLAIAVYWTVGLIGIAVK